jgi:hypothetical protein
MSADDEYEKIINDFTAKMARVKAPLSEYRAALRGAKEEIDLLLDADKSIDEGEE